MKKTRRVRIKGNRNLPIARDGMMIDSNGNPIKVGQYTVDSDTVRNIVREARAQGVDPSEALSIAYQESGIDKTNPYHLNPDFYGTNYGGPKSGVESIAKQMKWAKGLSDRGVVPNSDEYRLQGYNGYGKIKAGHADLNGSTSIYGQRIPKEGIDFKKNPLYGRRIIDVRDNIINKNKDIISIISEGQQRPIGNLPVIDPENDFSQIPQAKNGMSISNISQTGNQGDIMQFNGPSHENDGIPINYQGTQVEVEGQETGFVGQTGDLHIFGNMNVPGANIKFKNVGKKIANREKTVGKQLDNALELIQTKDPTDPFERFSVNSGKLMAKNAARQQDELSKQKEFLAGLQNAMLASGMGGSSTKAKNGITIARDGASEEPKKRKMSLAQRHNNPGNIMYYPSSAYQKSLGVTQGEPRMENGKVVGYYAKFPTMEAGKEGMSRQLFGSKNYQNLTVDQAARRWVHGSQNSPQVGYANIPSTLSGKRIKDLTAAEKKQALDLFTIGEDSKKYNWEGVTPDPTPTPGQGTPAQPIVPYDPFRPNTPPFVGGNPPQNPANPSNPGTPTTDTGTPYTGFDIPEETPRQPFRNPLHPDQLSGELYTLATERPGFVPGQTFEPELFQPYQVSFQDRLNQNNSTFRDISEQVGNNASVLSGLAGQKYAADNAVQAEQFRTNQGISNDITNKNIDLLNNAKQVNLQLGDTQFVRQSQAESNTRENIRNAMNSVSSKLAQNRLETMRYNAYSNLFPQYGFDQDGMVEYNPNEGQIFSAGGMGPGSAGDPATRTRATYDANGNLKQTIKVDPSAYEEAKLQQQIQEGQMKNTWRMRNQMFGSPSKRR